jgi:hypothetical protein
MRVFPSAGAFTLFLAFLTSTVGRPLSGQTGDGPVPCLFEWSTGFDETQVARYAATLADSCSDARAIPWDEKIAEAERAVSVYANDERLAAERAGLVAEWRKVLDRLAREKQHLADEKKRRAADSGHGSNASSGTSRESNSRPALAAATRGPVRFTIAPGDEPWAPAYLKETLKSNPGFNSTIATAKGAARIRRESVETPLQSGANIQLRAGDVVATGADGEVGIQFNDGSKLSIGTSTELLWSNSQACLGSFSGFPVLVRGMLAWTEGGNRLRSCPKTAETRYESVALRGAACTLKYGESNGRGVTTVSVQNGIVRVNDMYGNETTVATGAPRAFEHPIVSLLAGDPAARAIVDGRPLQQDHRTFESLDGELSGGLYYDPNVAERGALRSLALSSARQASPGARIIREEWRNVGPLSVLYVELDVTEAGSTDLLIGEYFTGAQGVAALVIQLPKDKLAERRADIAAVLNGLVSVNPFSLRAN